MHREMESCAALCFLRVVERQRALQDCRRAFTVISALKSFETGQPVSAALTAASNLVLSAPGMLATRSRWLLVMEKPSPTLASVMVAVVSSFCAVMPALPSCADSAMVKHPACAAANNSSGLVPIPFSKRVLNEYCVCFNTPLSVDKVPLPSLSPPVHTADALRSMCPLSLRCHVDIRFCAIEEGYIGRSKMSRSGFVGL